LNTKNYLSTFFVYISLFFTVASVSGVLAFSGQYAPVLAVAVLLLMGGLWLIYSYPYLTVVVFMFSSILKSAPIISNYVPDYGVLSDITVLSSLLVYTAIAIRLVRIPAEFGIKFRHEKGVFITFTIFVLVLLISSAFPSATSNGVDKVFRFVFLSSLSIYGTYFLVTSTRSMNQLMLAVLVISSLFAIFSRPDESVYNRFTAAGNNSIVVGRLAGIALIIFMGWFLPHVKKYKYLLGVGVGLLLGVPLIGSGSRGVVIALLCSIFASICVYHYVFGSGKLLIRLTLAIIVAGFLFPGISLILLKIVPDESIERISQLLTLGDAFAANARSELFSEALDVILYDLSLIGRGAGSFERLGILSIYGEVYQYPHNLLLEISFEQGVLGLLCFLILAILIFKEAMQMLFKICLIQSDNPHYSLKHEIEYYKWSTLTLITLLIFLFLNALVSGDLNANRWLLLTCGVSMVTNIQFQAAFTKMIDGKYLLARISHKTSLSLKQARF